MTHTLTLAIVLFATPAHAYTSAQAADFARNAMGVGQRTYTNPDAWRCWINVRRCGCWRRR